MIHAIRATTKGQTAVQTLPSNNSTAQRRLIILAIGFRADKWVSMSRLTTSLHDLSLTGDAQTREDLAGYWCDSDKLVSDLRWLNKQGLLTLARYKSEDGRFSEEAPQGLVFHAKSNP